MKYTALYIREFKHNLRKVYESFKKHSFKITLSLITVKLMDYSDHLPLWLLSDAALKAKVPDTANYLILTKLDQFRLLGDFELSVSYIASRGEKESHPHHTFISYSAESQTVKLRYYDYEGDIWRSAPLRAASFSVAAISFNAKGEATESVYSRSKMPKGKFLSRQQVYGLGKDITENLNKKRLYHPRSVTFACIQQGNLQLSACRFCNILPERIGDLLIKAECKIIMGIYREMIDQLNMVADLGSQQAFRSFISGSETKVFRYILGNKQFSIRKNSRCNQ